MSESTSYTNDLRRIAHAMATNQLNDVAGDLETGSRVDMLKDFVHGNLDKRCDKLMKALEFVQPALGEDFEATLQQFIKEVPLAAYDSGQYDGERFLQWLTQHRQLSPVQQDYVACQRARHRVEELGREHRVEHIRFQELASLAQNLAGELTTNAELQVVLNPLHTWTRFVSSEFIDEEEQPPVDVVFFAVGRDVATAVLEQDARAMIAELDVLQPCTIGTWAAVSKQADTEELIEFLADVAEMGLVAFR